RIPAWLAVGLSTTDSNGEPLQHVAVITVIKTTNAASTGNAIRLEGFEVEVEAGALQVLAFFEQDVIAVTSPSSGPSTSGNVLIENDSSNLGSIADPFLVGASAVANTNFVNAIISLATQQTVYVVVRFFVSAAVSFNILRDGTTIA